MGRDLSEHGRCRWEDWQRVCRGMKEVQMGGAGSVMWGEKSEDIWWTGGEWKRNDKNNWVRRWHCERTWQFVRESRNMWEIESWILCVWEGMIETEGRMIEQDVPFYISDWFAFPACSHLFRMLFIWSTWGETVDRENMTQAIEILRGNVCRIL